TAGPAAGAITRPSVQEATSTEMPYSSWRSTPSMLRMLHRAFWSSAELRWIVESSASARTQPSSSASQSVAWPLPPPGTKYPGTVSHTQLPSFVWKGQYRPVKPGPVHGRVQVEHVFPSVAMALPVPQGSALHVGPAASKRSQY